METKETGYILLHRSIRNHWLWKNPIQLQRWLSLLLSANYVDNQTQSKKTHEIIDIKRGELWTSGRSLAKEWGCSLGTVTRFLHLLEREKMILLQATQNGTFIKVLNYEVYQDFKGVSVNAKKNAKLNNDGTMTEQGRITLKNSNADNTVKEENISPPSDGGEWQ